MASLHQRQYFESIQTIFSVDPEDCFGGIVGHFCSLHHPLDKKFDETLFDAIDTPKRACSAGIIPGNDVKLFSEKLFIGIFIMFEETYYMNILLFCFWEKRSWGLPEKSLPKSVANVVPAAPKDACSAGFFPKSDINLFSEELVSG